MKPNTLVVDRGGWVNCPLRGHTSIEVCFNCSSFEELRDLPSADLKELGYKQLRCTYRRRPLVAR